jgi:hypothetical protein
MIGDVEWQTSHPNLAPGRTVAQLDSSGVGKSTLIPDPPFVIGFLDPESLHPILAKAA